MPILSTDMELEFIGPGHNSILNIPGTDEYFIIYHQHQGDAKFRRANIDRMTFNRFGGINTIRMTQEGVPAHPIYCWLSHATTGVHPSGEDKAFTLGTRLAADAIDSVTLYANGEVVYEGGYAEEFVWKAPTAGVYKIWAVVTDKAGKSYTTKALNADVV